MPYLTPAIRLRRTPFSRRVEEAGATAYTVYNHMLLASFFRSVEEDYAHLKKAVQVWDVSCERQVEIIGPDALRLLQLTTPRDLSGMADDQCYYIPMVDEEGHMLNDPIAIKLANDRYWVSIADTDMLYYFKGLANGFGLNAKAFEPDVSPLAIQGPKADTLIARVFGEKIANTKFFRYKTIEFQGKKMIIARSGWSHQGGFELYLAGSEYGEPIWDMLFDAGKDLDVRAGGPNLIERIEAGLLSYGNDITIDTTPFEAGLSKYCNLDKATDCLGHSALLAHQDPNRQIRSISIAGAPVPAITSYWTLKDQDGNRAGHISSATWSPDFETNVAIGMVDRAHWTPGTDLIVETENGEQSATVRDRFWI
jgi:dimethylsulfoniopropionate demethylase